MNDFEAWLKENQEKIQSSRQTVAVPEVVERTDPPRRKPGRPRKVKPEEQVANSVEEGSDVAASSPTPASLKVFIWPSFGGDDKGEGGIRRVVEAQLKHLPRFGIQIVETEEEAEVIAFHAECPPAFVNRFPDKPFVAMCHGLYWSEYDWDKWNLVANGKVMEGIRLADAVITCSDWVANSLRRHTSRPVSVIPHGVDADLWEYEPSQQLGYVLWNKTRPDPVCDPAPVNQVAARMPDVQFISTFGKEASNVKLVGKQPYEVAKRVVSRAGVYLCTTRETFGIGTLEALAAGVPIVGWNFGGQAEFIQHGVNGWLARPGDIDGLVQGIRWALDKRSEIAPACRALAEEFTWEAACEQYAKIFRETHSTKRAEGVRTSVIVTNYQLHEFLSECLESVRNQSDGDFECIIVDDASPDASGRRIAEEFCERDSRFRLIANEQNVYLSEARNIGIRVARGKYILPLDADDMLTPNAIADLSSALDNDKSIHIAYGKVFFVDEDGKTPTDYSDVYGRGKMTPGHSAWPFQFVFEQQIQERNYLPYSSMYRRPVWENIGGYRRRCRTAEDADFWTRASSYGFRPKMVSESLTLIYRNRSGSMSREQGAANWIRWFSWSKVPALTPAGAVTREQLPVPSLDPILVSVIIPVGPGHEKYVHDAIDSVSAQSFQNWEVIVVNDTGKPLPELPAFVHVLEPEGAGASGPARSRNVGIQASRGTCFLPLDADDYLEPDALQFMWDAYLKTKGVVYSDFWQTDGNKTTRHNCDDYDPELLTGGKRMVDGEMRSGMIHSVTALTPKKFWEEINGYDEDLPGWEDWDFQLGIGDRGHCSIRVPYPLFTYRKHLGSRREENYASFDKSKEGILRKWSKLWEGGKKLMACGSCSARKSIQPSSSMMTANAQRVRQGSDATLIRYVGNKAGSIGYRGKSKTMYYFAKGETKFVLNDDVDMFKGMPDFEVVTTQAEPLQQVKEPVLVAERSA